MTSRGATVLGLRTLLDQGRLGVRAARRCTALIERLDAPVRVAIFGLPGAGKSAVTNALAGSEVLAVGTQRVPVLMQNAPQSRLTVTQADGCSNEIAASLPMMPPPEAVFLRLDLPLPSLQNMSLLTVIADGTAKDMAQAMAWAARRTDIAVWCSRDWTETEQGIWTQAPDSLKNHALMVTGKALARVTAGALLPEAAHALRADLAAMIDAARGEDMDAAAFLLEQSGAPVRSEARKTPDDARPAAQAHPITPVANSEAVTCLTQMLFMLRRAANDLATEIDKGSTPDQIAPRLGEILDDLLDRAEADQAFAETWPELSETLRDAGELALLLGLEGGAAEAAALLAQVRLDMGLALAA